MEPAWACGQRTLRTRAAVALSETSEGVLERAGDTCQVREDELENWGMVDIGIVAMEVLLKVGTRLEVLWRLEGRLCHPGLVRGEHILVFLVVNRIPPGQSSL